MLTKVVASLGAGILLAMATTIYFLWGALDDAKEKFARLDTVVNVYKETNDRMVETMKEIRGFEDFLVDLRTKQNQFQQEVLTSLDRTNTVYIDRVKTDEITKVWDAQTVPTWIQEKNKQGGTQ